jgi:hypothetical protein
MAKKDSAGDISVAKGGRLQVEDEKGRKLFVSLKDAVDNLNSKNQETHVKEMAQAQLDQAVSESNTEELIANMVEAKALEQKKEKHQDIIKKAAERDLAIQNGEYGFRGLFKNGKESLKNALMMDKSLSEGFSEVGQALSNDLQFLGTMLSPLTAIPGVSTALTFLKFAGGNLLKLATVEGRLNAKKWIMAKKKWIWEKAQAAKNAIMNRGRQLKKDGVKGSLVKGGKSLFSLFTKLFRTVAIVVFGIIAFVLGFFKGIGTQLAKLFSGPWNKIKNAFAAVKLKWANSKSISNMFKGPWDKIKNVFKGLKLPPGVTNAMNTIKGFFGSVKGGVGSAFTKIRNLMSPVQKAISSLMNSPVVEFMGKLGTKLGRFFVPLTILMGAWKTITGFLDGFKNMEGSFIDKVIAGIYGAVEGLVNFFITMPMDFIKDIMAWIAEKLGFIGPETKAKINDFSFVEVFSSMFEGLTNMVLELKKWVGAVLAGAWAAVKAAWPGGETPMEAFQKAYSKSMDSPTAVYKSQALMDIDADKLDAAADANKREEDRVDSDRAKGNSGGNLNAVTSNTNIKQGGKTIQINSTGPKDNAAFGWNNPHFN